MALIRFFVIIALLFSSYSAGASLCADMLSCPAASATDEGCSDAGCDSCAGHSALAVFVAPVPAYAAATPEISFPPALPRDAVFPNLRPPDFLA